jgi:hypothetical protein
MKRDKLAFLIAAEFALALTHGAKAVPLNPLVGTPKENADRSNLTRQIHGCHYSCECGPLRNFGCKQIYHRHLHMGCLAVRCDRRKECDRIPPEGVCRHIAPQ